MTKPFTSLNIFENFGFSKFRCHAPIRLVTYNFLGLQRLTVIFSENKNQTRCDNMSRKRFQNTLASSTKIRSKDRKTPNCTNTIVWTIAPAGAISLRCNHSTGHLEYEPRRREAMKFAPAKKFHEFGLPNPSPA